MVATSAPLNREDLVKHCIRAWLAFQRRSAGQRGQSTAEYALLTAAMALLLGLVAAWAASTGRIEQLLDTVFGRLVDAAEQM
jgi:hypothetical protein